MMKGLPVCVDRFSDVSANRPRQIVMYIQPFIGNQTLRYQEGSFKTCKAKIPYTR